MREQGSVMVGHAISNGAVAYSYGDAKEIGRKPELAGQIERLQMNTAAAGELMDRLTDKLDGVMRPEDPQQTSSGPAQIQSAPPSTPYALQVYEQQHFLGLLNERLRGLLQRLEV